MFLKAAAGQAAVLAVFGVGSDPQTAGLTTGALLVDPATGAQVGTVEKLKDSQYQNVVVPGHPETLVEPYQPDCLNCNHFVTNASGTLAAAERAVWRASDGEDGTATALTCGSFIGWADDSRLVTWTDVGPRVVTVSANGQTATCGPVLLPPNSRSPRSPFLALDGSGVYFVAQGSSGNSESFFVPLDGGPIEPGSPPSLPPGLHLFYGQA